MHLPAALDADKHSNMSLSVAYIDKYSPNYIFLIHRKEHLLLLQFIIYLNHFYIRKLLQLGVQPT